MKRFFLPIMLVVVFFGMLIFYALSRQPQPALPISLIPTPQSSSTSSPIAIHVPADIFGSEADFLQLNNRMSTNASTGVTVSFKKIDTGSRNLAADVFVDRVKVNGKYDEVGGQGESLLTFSPDNKYFAWRSRWTTGCCSSDYAIYLIDLVNKTIKQINPPRREQDYVGPRESPTQSIMPFIESYTWDSDALQITFYFVGFSSDQNYYRISSKEIWRYDLVNGNYAFVQTLP